MELPIGRGSLTRCPLPASWGRRVRIEIHLDVPCAAPRAGFEDRPTRAPCPVGRPLMPVTEVVEFFGTIALKQGTNVGWKRYLVAILGGIKIGSPLEWIVLRNLCSRSREFSGSTLRETQLEFRGILNSQGIGLSWMITATISLQFGLVVVGSWRVRQGGIC